MFKCGSKIGLAVARKGWQNVIFMAEPIKANKPLAFI